MIMRHIRKASNHNQYLQGCRTGQISCTSPCLEICNIQGGTVCFFQNDVHPHNVLLQQLQNNRCQILSYIAPYCYNNQFSVYLTLQLHAIYYYRKMKIVVNQKRQ